MRVILKAYNLKLGLAIYRQVDKYCEGELTALIKNPKKENTNLWDSTPDIETLSRVAIALHSDPGTVRPGTTYLSSSHAKVFLKNEWTRVLAPPETLDE